MLVVRGRLENRQAIVEIGFQSFVPAAPDVASMQPSFSIPIESYRALLDTGAQRTCLARSVIAKEGLRRHGKRFIQNVHSEAMHYLYWAQIGFWANGTHDNASEVRTYYSLPLPIEIIDIADNANFDAIVGMDALQRCDVTFERSGHFEVRLV